MLARSNRYPFYIASNKIGFAHSFLIHSFIPNHSHNSFCHQCEIIRIKFNRIENEWMENPKLQSIYELKTTTTTTKLLITSNHVYICMNTHDVRG